MPVQPQSPQFGLPRPGPVLKGVLITLFLLWVTFALAINWGGASDEVFSLFVGNTEAIRNGEVWRLVTPLFMHMYTQTVSHIFTVLLGLYFLGSSLEESWGSRRFLKFLLLTGVLAYAVQFVAGLVLPAFFRDRLVPEAWFGAMPVVDAVAIAWALSFKNRTVLLFFVLPVSSRGLLLMVIGMNVLMVIAGAGNFAGHVALFAGMGAGWLFGAGTPSPARRWLLKLRMKQLASEEAKLKHERKGRVQRSSLRVIEGGRAKEDSSPDDKTWLN